MQPDIKNICMLSTHGYFDPVPKLGRTDTGGQIVYVLQLAKTLSKLNFKVDIYTRWFDPQIKQIEHVPYYPDVRIIRIQAGPWKFIQKKKKPAGPTFDHFSSKWRNGFFFPSNG